MCDGLLPLRPYAEALSKSLGEVLHLRSLSSNAPISLALHKSVVGCIAERDAATLGAGAERLHGEFLRAIHIALGGHVLPGNRTGNAWPMGPSAFACSKGWDVLRPYLVGLGCHQRSANPHQRMAVYAYLRIACSKGATHVCTVYDNLLHIYVTFRIQGKPHAIATVALRSLRHISVGVTFASVAVCKSSHSSGPMQIYPTAGTHFGDTANLNQTTFAKSSYPFSLSLSCLVPPFSCSNRKGTFLLSSWVILSP